ncbi:DUF742 domain-containing protein [Streptomyces nanshensis]|uniref:DUF742 domain-containing protein n=1 Tax=Streptomyces nanshensis TaxID=518642 RepID=A0A1E7KZH4_9ACTN|nr:DUF742 domain-containing protein [Streptomyces nanshensis]OEV09281.1 hypothetical protein AN218_22805 [Streptomyces nanshensis]
MTPPGRRRAGMVRPYTPTGGQAIASRASLDLATILIADQDRPLHALSSHQHRVMEHCLPGPLSIAEVSAHLQLPGAVTKVVAASLVDSGHLISRAPVPAAQQHDKEFLERLLDGLRKL